jgi:dihydroorotate dehydrogenase (NAD+) catalytic subunit
VHQVAQTVKTPIVAIGGIATIDDVMEFLVTGASAVQIGTANYYDPTVSMKILDQLPEALAEAGVGRVRDLVATLGSVESQELRVKSQRGQESGPSSVRPIGQQV